MAGACIAGPLVVWWEQPPSGDASMAAALHGAMASLCLFAAGLPFALLALRHERARKVLCGVTVTLYAVPLLILVGILWVHLVNR